MPLTAVGKIFKPQLRNLEAEAALRDALQDAGVTLLRLSVLNDPQIGTSVEASVHGTDEEKMALQVLGQFPFRFRLARTANASDESAWQVPS